MIFFLHMFNTLALSSLFPEIYLLGELGERGSIILTLSLIFLLMSMSQKLLTECQCDFSLGKSRTHFKRAG